MSDEVVLGPGAKSGTEELKGKTKAELVDEAELRGLSTSGTKEELLERLAGNEEEPNG